MPNAINTPEESQFIISFWFFVSNISNFKFFKLFKIYDNANAVTIEGYDKGSGILGLKFSINNEYFIITNPSSITLNNWQFFFSSCHGLPEYLPFIFCNFTTLSGSSFNTFSSSIDYHLLKFGIGDNNNPIETNFIMKELIITTGALYS